MTQIASPPTEAFGYFIRTEKPADRVADQAGVSVRDRSFQLINGYGMNVIATPQQLEGLKGDLRDHGIPALQQLTLVDGTGRTPVYNIANRGGTSLPIRSHYI